MVKLRLSNVPESKKPIIFELIRTLEGLIYSIEGNYNVNAELVDTTPANVGRALKLTPIGKRLGNIHFYSKCDLPGRPQLEYDGPEGFQVFLPENRQSYYFQREPDSAN